MAVMGPSGCGKTTLLDILADRVSSGKREGDLELNGLPRNIKQFRSMACYVAQEDSLLGSFMCVIEALVSNAIMAIAAGASVYGMFMLWQGFMVPPPAIPNS